jgi:hypothetical protein
MSSDAKAWTDDGWVWKGVNDLCERKHDAVGLVELLRQLEVCENKGNPMRWELFQYTDGSLGLRGFCC